MERTRLTQLDIDSRFLVDIDAEMALAGTVALDPGTLDHISHITTHDFTDSLAAQIFAVVRQLDGRSISPETLVAELTDRGMDKRVAIEAVGDVLNKVVTAAHAPYWAERVKKASRLRDYRALADKINACTDPDEIGALIDRESIRIAEASLGNASILNSHETAQATIDMWQARWSGAVVRIPTGICDVDKMLGGGFGPGELVVIGGRTAQGKTAFAVNVTVYDLLTQGEAVVIVSLEMSAADLGERMALCHGRINGRDIDYDPHVRSEALEAVNAVANTRLTVDESPSRTVRDIEALARLKRRQRQLDMLVIDYLQLVNPDDRRLPRHEQVAEMSRRLKNLARELDVPVVCLAQVNRETQKTKGDGRPKLHHLRESGAIEQDADKVLFVHRPEEGNAEIIVEKHRRGPTGIVQVFWNGEQMRFAPLRQEPRAHEDLSSWD